MLTTQSNKYKKIKHKQLILSIAISIGLNQTAQAQFTNPLQLSSINGTNGFVIHGVDTGDQSGASVSSAGDINGDGVDDLLIGAYRADSDAGSTYVVFGSSTGLPDSLNLSSLNGSNGFVIHGVDIGDRSGTSVSSAGDINGDGVDDVLVGADEAAPNNNTFGGSSYVVFGSSTGQTNPLNLSGLNGSNGFVIHGEDAYDYSGRSVSSAGDINGDGVDDLLIGANYADPNNNSDSGSSYVVFGNSVGQSNPLNLNKLNGANGFAIHGESDFDRSGGSVSSAGDINDDGIDDLLIGAIGAGSNGNLGSGKTYVVFGSSTGLDHPLMLGNLNGSNGFVINGGNAGDISGKSVSSAGDINGDGIDDILIGAIGANSRAGSTYVVYGSSIVQVNPLELSDLNGSNGLVIHGENAFDQSGNSVSSAGDINGDGLDDILIGAYFADSNDNSAAGSTYVVFGSSTGQPSPLNLNSLNGSNGFVIHGESINDISGISVSSAGDINGDGVDDILIGASNADPNDNTIAGSTYVLFGIKTDLIFKNSFEN